MIFIKTSEEAAPGQRLGGARGVRESSGFLTCEECEGGTDLTPLGRRRPAERFHDLTAVNRLWSRVSLQNTAARPPDAAQIRHYYQKYVYNR